MKKFLLPALIVFSTLPWFAAAQEEKIDTATVSRIKDEGFNRSQVMSILSMLTDVYGPRLTNSVNHKKAAAYAQTTLKSWGLVNVHSDTWEEDFGRGWELKKFSLQNLEPVYFPVLAYPKAWTQGVTGTIQAEAIYLDVQKEEDIAKYKGKLKGKIILFSLPQPVKPSFSPDATRLTDSALLVLANSQPTEAYTGRRFQAPTAPERIAYLKWELCKKEGAIAVLEASSSKLGDGMLTVHAATIPYAPEVPPFARSLAWDADVPKSLPQIVVAAEHYNRMVRQLEKNIPVKLELTLETVFSDPAPGFNVIAEIQGTDLKDEIVMIGAHLDSWHSGTGTCDNGAGSAVIMEAMRILKTIGKAPRRTIRIALWGGEEQGLLGSRSYVRRHFGEFLDRRFPYDSLALTPAGEKFSVYFNTDLGVGKFRGVYLQANQAVLPIFRAWIKPFENLGASTLTLRSISGTDHLVFDAIGLPAFQFIQDPVEYGTRTYHSNLDLFDKAVESDLKHNASMMAAFAWCAANRDERVPRKK